MAQALAEFYPESGCTLAYGGEPWKLLVMARLSAQCTDARVNEVCRVLFARYSTPEALAAADLSELEELVRPCGLFHVKARDIREECRVLATEWGGVLPSDEEELLRLPGVGRKIANLLRGDLFGIPGIVADTHCIRVSARLGLTAPGESSPSRTERALGSLLPPEEQTAFCHRVVDFGREICTARAPRCAACPLASLCDTAARAGE